jgi:hypothetical protein
VIVERFEPRAQPGEIRGFEVVNPALARDGENRRPLILVGGVIATSGATPEDLSPVCPPPHAADAGAAQLLS